jgi:tripartite-type tricarboxylate transporter receptor subunit TctC
MLRALIAALLFTPLALTPAAAQDWPSRQINVIVPLGAGSASDIIARA